MELTEADSGVECAVAVGDDVVVVLAENRTTGFRWHLNDLPDGVVVVDDGFDAPDPGRPGQGGVHRFHLRPGRAGEYRIAARLRRSWGDDAPQRTVEFPLRVS